MSILDAAIILILLLGAVLGFKRGIITSVVMFVGTIVVIVLAYLFKNPISTIMYTYLPFFKFGGALEGVTVINILIYEGIAFLITFGVLMVLYRILVFATKIIEKVFKATIILSIPSKLLGALFGALEAFILLFVGLYCINQFNWFSGLTKDAKFDDKILTKTPFLSNYVDKGLGYATEIYDLQEKYRTSDKNGVKYNEEALEILLKNKVIDTKSVKKLDEKDKLNIPKEDLNKLIEKYEGK